MKFTDFIATRKSRAPLLLLLLSGIAAGCGSGGSASGSAAGPERPKQKSAATNAEEAVAEGPRVSVFASGPGTRDPFYPHLKKAEEKATIAATANQGTPGDVQAFLNAGFQGILGTPDRRMAMIHNTILEPRKSAVITARLNGREYKVALRCLEVAWDSVTVQVDGKGFPITINRQTNPKL